MFHDDDLSSMSYLEPQTGETVKCFHCWNTVRRDDIALADSCCPRCGRHLDMDEEPYA